MTCGHCEKAVTRAVHSVDPAARVMVERQAGRVSVDSDADAQVIRQAIEDEGYSAETARPSHEALRSGDMRGGTARHLQRPELGIFLSAGMGFAQPQHRGEHGAAMEDMMPGMREGDRPRWMPCALRRAR